MKGNNGTGNIPERDLWETDQVVWNKLNNQYNFLFDCCASESNRKCNLYSNNFLNYNDHNKHIVAWMNPPFSKANEMFKHFFKIITKGVAIYRCDNMETKVWQEIILKNADWIFIPKRRWAYTPFEVGNMRNGSGTRFPSALIGIGVEPPKLDNGTILYISQKQ